MAAKRGSPLGPAGHDPIEILVRGRRNKIKPLGEGDKRSALRRLVRRAPEVMLKVTGGGKTKAHVMQHLRYITRAGKLEAYTDEHSLLSGRAELDELMSAWGLDVAKGAGKNKLVHNIIFSMPEGTDAAKLHQAVKNFARNEFFGTRPYLMVLHEPDTDPSKKKAKHPHVHMVIPIEDYNGKRLQLRKAELESWRTKFAEQLREQGVEANATIREVRGQTRKSKHLNLIKLDEDRRPSHVRDGKMRAARDDIHQGEPQYAWDEKIAQRRTAVVDAFGQAANQLRDSGDPILAAEVEQFAASLPPIQTERQMLAAFMKKSVAAQRAQKKQEIPAPTKEVPQTSSRKSDTPER